MKIKIRCMICDRIFEKDITWVRELEEDLTCDDCLQDLEVEEF